MEDDTNARRKLEFQGKPFRSKLFYVNVKTRAVRQRVEAYICDLGGSIETFLTNDIHLFISDSRPLTKRTSERGVNRRTDTVPGNKQPVPLSRGRALLLKARTHSNDNLSSEVNALADIQEKAVEMGMKIEHVHTFLKRCKALGATSKTQFKKRDSFSDVTPLKWNEKCFIKVEDDKCQYKPLYKRLDNLPQLFPDSGGASPFDGPVVLHKPSTESAAKKDRKTSRFSHNKGGYCEMCQCLFKTSLKQHMKCSTHQRYVRNKENFKKLDKIMRKMPSLNTFLFKYIPAKCSSRVPCYQSDSSSSTPDTSKCDDDVFIFSDNNSECNANDGDISESALAGNVMDETCVHTTISNQQMCTASDNVLAKIAPSDVCRSITRDISIPSGIDGSYYVKFTDCFDNEVSDKVFSDCSGRLTDGCPATANNLGVTSNVKTFPDLESNGATKKRVAGIGDLQFTTGHGDVLSDLLGEKQEESYMFSDLTESDSQTNALKRLIDNLSLHNERPTSQPIYTESPLDIASNPPSPACLSSSSTCVTDVTITTSTSTTTSDDNDETSMSQGTPVSVVETPGSIKTKLYLDSRTCKKSKVSMLFDDNDSMYRSHKTSDTKLKLCRVIVTPVNQKSNLKMFWKVRKTGDCRLVFSAEKRKRSQDDGIHGDTDNLAGSVKGRYSGHKRKRQRLDF